jgi:Zn-dependent M16 (insulinase) family peptidase
MARRSILSLAILSTALITAQGYNLHAQDASPFQNLRDGERMNGFRATAVYLDDADKPMGARFVHERTGFVLDLLQIQSVPQGFIWVNSFPTSDMGEPHTQEHLLLGKGNMGRYVSNLEDMSVTSSSAFTQQWRTCYHFNTGAGAEVFYEQFEKRLDAMLHPDYSDEEIRREVRNFGVSVNPGDGALRLEEKGSVYNEMVRAFDMPWTRMSRELDIALYGKDHPLAFVSGGAPEAIREMKPHHIRLFHRQHYYLGNMGMVGSFPKEMGTKDILKRADAILNKLQPKEIKPDPIMTEATLPAPKSAPAGSIYIVDYPNKNDQQPGPLVYAWPATLKLSAEEQLLIDLFVTNFAGDPSTNLYKLFIDTKTRQMDAGAQGVYGWVSSDQGHVVYMGLDNYPAANISEEKIKEIRGKIIDELKRVASWGDGSPELAEFNTRLKNRIIGTRRDLAKFVNSPPGFGFRGTGSGWMSHLYSLGKMEGFRKSVTLKQQLDEIEKMLAGGKNIWRDRIAAWKLTENIPYAGASRPSAELIKKEEGERQERIAAEVSRLTRDYGIADDQGAIRRYQANYDSTTVDLDRIAASVPTPKFIDNPPLTLDEQLDYTVTSLPGNVQMVASTFDNMTSATTGLALRLQSVPEDEYVYLSLLPALLTEVGVIENGKPISYEEMTERQRQEILGLNADFVTNSKTGRVELVIRGSGNDLAESQRSLEWMKLLLFHPNWGAENLPRMRDVVDQALSGFRGIMLGREESWVHNPAGAFRWQGNKLMLATESSLTRAHHALRLRWLLKDAGTQGDAISAYLANLAGAANTATRDDLKSLLGAIQGKGEMEAKVPAGLKGYLSDFNALPAEAKQHAIEAAKDLDLTLNDIPDGSLAADWRYLCGQMRHDLLVSPTKALADLNTLRQRILVTGSARMFMIGSRASQQKLAAPVKDLVSRLAPVPAMALPASNEMVINDRIRERHPNATKPVFVGLVNPSTSSGVFIHSAPGVDYHDTTRNKLLQYLAFNLYAGGGAHGIFMKTWGAGLAYSNGLGANPASGRVSYYAERCPELPQTLRFVIDELKKAQPDSSLVEYVIAQALGHVRAADNYETRGEAMAADLADGLNPDVVRTFRKAILELRKLPNLTDKLYMRKDMVYGRILPGYGQSVQTEQGGVYYVIGPEKQLSIYEKYLQSVEGSSTQLYRIYPRDYWITLKDAEIGMRNE